jgi:hypothetical protein
VGVGLTVLAAMVAKRISCPWLAGRTLMPNLYTLLVGPSRSTRKTGSMDAGIDVLQGIDSSLVMPIPGSYEELVAQIRQKPDGLLTYREFGHFLKTTQKGYGEPIRTVLMDLHDWPSDRPYVRNLKKGKTVVPPPICLSLLSSIATDLLFSFTDLEEWTGGFFGRMLLLYGERDNFKMPLTWASQRDTIVNHYRGYLADLPACGGFAPEGWAAFENWSRWRDGQTNVLPHRVQTFMAGAPTLVGKVALLYALDSGEVTGVGWLASYESVYRAVRFVEDLYLPSVRHLGERLALGVWERDRQKVIDVIGAVPMGISRRDVLKRAKVSSEYLDTIVGTLKEEGTIVQGSDARGIVYRCVHGEVAPVIPLRPSGVDEESAT